MGRKSCLATWKDSGKWPEYREILIQCILSGATDKEIASCLKISPDTYTSFKKIPEIRQLIEETKFNDKKHFLDNVRKLADGAEHKVTRKTMKTKDGKVVGERVAGEVVTKMPPSLDANRYLLAILYGDEFAIEYRKLKILENKVKNELGGWENANVESEDSNKED